MKVQRVADPSEFEATLASTLSAAAGRVFVVVFGTEEAATGESWCVIFVPCIHTHACLTEDAIGRCPDCVTSDPLIRKAVLTVKDSVLVEVPAGDRPTYRDPKNFYRNHEQLKVTAVPTLYEFGKDGKVIKKLVESEITSASLAAFVQ
ncbi:hypothetical protein CcCBS67573_g07763 [Chytriomyces confervae]|uniref:Thioredoxin domain-containing protein n=1 Tax=Chytriomyces confervae TaxID=246404 RepID=A0A507ETS8_9FUNG|nr:hypothetical protein CcCBS67573_g07763 [Chytriomyces confervae]